jgi:hypothetical protein
MMEIWITDGSAAPFGDIPVLPAHHPGTLGGDIPYKGAVDESVPVGNATVCAEGAADRFVPEAEWCICFPGGTDPFLADPDALTESTPIVMQGMIDLRGHNLLGLTRAVFGYCREHKLAPEISEIAIDQGLVVEPGTPLDLAVTAATEIVGRGQLTLSNRT